jgi:hypothetical protein
MKVEIEIPEDDLVAAIEKKVRQYVAAEAASWQVGEYIRDRIREKWKAAADLVIAEVLDNGPELRAKIAEEIEKKLRAQLTAALRQAGR